MFAGAVRETADQVRALLALEDDFRVRREAAVAVRRPTDDATRSAFSESMETARSDIDAEFAVRRREIDERYGFAPPTASGDGGADDADEGDEGGNGSGDDDGDDNGGDA